MAPFVPPEPPLEPDTIGAPTLDVPLPPPEVGFGSPWAPADGENRDHILDWWRMWFRRVFFPWINAWIAYWAAQWKKIIDYLNTWIEAADEYITLHAVNGHSWWKTTTPIDDTNPTTVELPYDQYRPILVGDLVSDTSDDIRYGQVTALVDDTHAIVTPLGTLRGLTGFAGFGWWTTATPIATTGTTDVVLAIGDRDPQVGDLVLDSTAQVAYGMITAVTDPEHVTVTHTGTLQGPPGIADVGAYDLTTASLAPYGDPGDTHEGVMVGQPNMVGAYVITTTSRCWVRVYASEAYMLADATRDILTPLTISDDHGCYLDYVAIPGALDKTLTPGIQFTDVGGGLWISVKNTNVTTPTAIGIHFDYRIFRE